MKACPTPKATVAASRKPAKQQVTAPVEEQTTPAAKSPAKFKVTKNKAGDIRIKIQVDDRTKKMPAEALECRSLGHAWQRIPLGAARRLELLQRGETETIRICTRCRSRRTDVYELPTFFTLFSKIDYSDGYLISKEHAGSGRMPRNAATAASIVAEFPELVATS